MPSNKTSQMFYTYILQSLKDYEITLVIQIT